MFSLIDETQSAFPRERRTLEEGELTSRKECLVVSSPISHSSSSQDCPLPSSGTAAAYSLERASDPDDCLEQLESI